mmetsp:Transcript_37216/g.92542  ORF Transcript_37216/g.92542 Transcript_37216/m.92542 type:complete len:202 (+) Transcript_37216:2030-2635(+)
MKRLSGSASASAGTSPSRLADASCKPKAPAAPRAASPSAAPPPAPTPASAPTYTPAPAADDHANTASVSDPDTAASPPPRPPPKLPFAAGESPPKRGARDPTPAPASVPAAPASSTPTLECPYNAEEVTLVLTPESPPLIIAIPASAPKDIPSSPARMFLCRRRVLAACTLMLLATATCPAHAATVTANSSGATHLSTTHT